MPIRRRKKKQINDKTFGKNKKSNINKLIEKFRIFRKCNIEDTES